MKTVWTSLLLCAAATMISACGSRQMPDPEAGGKPLLEGIVVETMDASRYTYLRVDDDAAMHWVATPLTAVNVGERVSVPHAEEMRDFHSKSLDRTFERIYFATGITVAENTTRKRPHHDPHVDMPGLNTVTGKIIETMDAQRYTYILLRSGEEEIWVASTRFDADVGDTVSVSIGMPMKDFYSKTLDRTFERIYFTGFVRTIDKGNSAR